MSGAEAGPGKVRPTAHAADDPRLWSLVDDAAAFEPVAHQADFRFIEGPLWDAAAGELLFSDIPASVIRRWRAADGSVREWRRPTNLSNALTYDAQGRLLVCEHVPPGVRRLPADGAGEGELLASHWQGKELNSPNDLVVRERCGSVYFSDPPSGRTKEWGVERPQELDFQGLFRIDPSGALHLLADEYVIPNGVCLSPDERTLYCVDSHEGEIKAYDLADDGSVTGARLFAQGLVTDDLYDGCPDGVKCDEHGNVWVSAPWGVWVYAPDGTRLGRLASPEFITNFTWGGPDGRDLFLCGFTTLFRLRTHVRGSGIPARRGRASL